MEVKFMCGRKAKVARRGIAACGRSFFRGDCLAVRQQEDRVASAMAGQSVNFIAITQ
jgi:hypothetical protein